MVDVKKPGEVVRDQNLKNFADDTLSINMVVKIHFHVREQIINRAKK